MEGFRNLIAWQKAYEFALAVYKVTKKFPKSEQYGLVSQICRAAISVIGNIAEGYERQYRKEYVQFLMIAKGSLGELETYLLLARDLCYLSVGEYDGLEIMRKEASKIITGLIRSLRPGSWLLDPGPSPGKSLYKKEVTNV